MVDFDPDEYLASKSGVNVKNTGIAPAKVTVPTSQSLGFDPDLYINTKKAANYDALQAKYGTTSQQIQAGLEALARGFTMGVSDVAMTAPALMADKPIEESKKIAEELRGRMDANPITEFIGNTVGGGALIAATGGLAAPAEAALIAKGFSPLAARGLAYGAENMMMGGVNAISEDALGDPKLNAEHIIAQSAMSSLFGAWLGTLSKAVGASPSLARKIFSRAEGAENKTAQEVAAGLTKAAHADIPESDIAGVAGISPEELSKLAENAKYSGEVTHEPAYEHAADALSRLPELNNKITPVQLEVLKDKVAAKKLKIAAEKDDELGHGLRVLKILQKNELVDRSAMELEHAAEGYKPTPDLLEGGERAADILTNRIEERRKELGPVIRELKKTAVEEVDHLPGVLDYLTGGIEKETPSGVRKIGNPQLATMFDENGKILPWSDNIKVDKKTYQNVKSVISALKENPNDFENLFNLRKKLTSGINKMITGDAQSELTNASAAMMEYIQDTIQKHVPDARVRDAFAAYARNEELAKNVERKIGAEIGTDNWRSLAKGKADENILSKIFKDSETVRLAQEAWGSDFPKVRSDYLAAMKERFTTDGALSASRWNKFLLKDKNIPLKVAFEGQEGSLQKLKDLSTVMKMFSDNLPVNPSETADTLIQKLNFHSVTGLLASLGHAAKEKVKDEVSKMEIKNALAGKSDLAIKLNTIKKMSEDFTNKLMDTTKSIFKSNFTRGAIESTIKQMNDKAFHDHSSRIKQLANDQTAMLDHLGDSTADLHGAAPNTTMGVHGTLIAGVNFLNSKLPHRPNSLFYDSEYKPSKEQKAKFERYFNAVNDPMTVLKSVANGTLTNEGLEALVSVYPSVYNQMKMAIMDKMDPSKQHHIPYQVKMSLAKFLNQPLDTNMLPGVRQSFQASLQGPQQSTQQAPKQQRSTLGGLKQLKMANRTSDTWNRDETS